MSETHRTLLLSLSPVLGAAIFCLQARFSLFIRSCSAPINIYQSYYINRFVTSTETQQFNSWNSWHVGEQKKNIFDIYRCILKLLRPNLILKSVELSVVVVFLISGKSFSTTKKIWIWICHQHIVTENAVIIYTPNVVPDLSPQKEKWGRI